MSNLRDHAENELRISGWAGNEGFYGDLVEKAVLEIVDIFDNQGHSGMSAPLVVGIVEKLLMFEPLTPLTGEDDEWTILDYEGELYAQNKRCSHVFQRRDGSAYDSEGRVFINQHGVAWTGRDSRIDIRFPYTPAREYVHVVEEDDE